MFGFRHRALGLGAGLGLAVALLACAPSALAAPTHAYVTNYESIGNLTPFTIGAGGLLHATAAAVSTSGGEPWYSAMTPDGRHLYVTNNEQDTIAQFNVSSTGQLTPMSPATVTTVNEPVTIAISPNGQTAYVGSGALNSTSIGLFNIGSDGRLTPKVPATINTHFGEPQGIALTPDGQNLYVADWASDNVAEFHVLSDGSLEPMASPSAPAGAAPAFVAVTPDGKHAYVANNGDGTVSEYSIGSSGRLFPIGHVTAGPAENFYSVTISPNGKSLYAADDSTVAEFGIGSSGVLTAKGTAPAHGGGAENLWFTADGKSAYLANYNSGQASNVAEYNVSAAGLLTAKSTATVPAGGGPASVMIPPDQGPHASIDVAVRPAGTGTRFDASKSTDSDGSIVRYDWNFGDGTVEPNAGRSPKHVYKAGGTFTVTVTVTDDSGCSTSFVFTGQTAYCNAGAQGEATEIVPIPPLTKITKSSISQTHHTASFQFKAIGVAQEFECGLQLPAKPHHKPDPAKFKICKSPETYKHLRAGRYTFMVRAFNQGGGGNLVSDKFKIR